MIGGLLGHCGDVLVHAVVSCAGGGLLLKQFVEPELLCVVIKCYFDNTPCWDAHVVARTSVFGGASGCGWRCSVRLDAACMVLAVGQHDGGRYPVGPFSCYYSVAACWSWMRLIEIDVLTWAECAVGIIVVGVEI